MLKKISWPGHSGSEDCWKRHVYYIQETLIPHRRRIVFKLGSFNNVISWLVVLWLIHPTLNPLDYISYEAHHGRSKLDISMAHDDHRKTHVMLPQHWISDSPSWQAATASNLQRRCIFQSIKIHVQNLQTHNQIEK